MWSCAAVVASVSFYELLHHSLHNASQNHIFAGILVYTYYTSTGRTLLFVISETVEVRIIYVSLAL